MANICQSCGMPLNKDPKGGGTETDGSKSTTYCSICYADGDFVHKGVSVKEFQDHCVEALKSKGMPHIMAWMFTRNIPRLGRWRG